jgi:hypothetical protein
VKVVAAVRELQQEHGDRVDFVIVPAAETARRQDEIEEFGFTDLKHGLVAFDREGRARVKLAGHQFGKPEIEAAMWEVLGEG